MQKKRTIPYFFAFLAVTFSAAAISLALFCRNVSPVLLHKPEEAAQRAQALMETVCDGDFALAETMLYGTPDLGIDREPRDPVGSMIWNAYVASLDYRLQGELYATDTGLAQDVKLISLELDSVTKNLGSRARTLLNERIGAAEDVAELYDENNEYREDLVMEILEEAARQALEEDVRYAYQIIPLQLIYREDQWWVAADQVFLNAISGGITG